MQTMLFFYFSLAIPEDDNSCSNGKICHLFICVMLELLKILNLQSYLLHSSFFSPPTKDSLV